MGERKRHEIKYICSEPELRMIEKRLSAILKPDPHADENGEYLIRSVYFDDYNRSCFYENENGIDPREKFRIRIYNYSDNRITLEKKKKKNGMTSKASCGLDYDTCMKMLRSESISERMGENSLLDEWIALSKSRLLKPVMLGEYVRKPYVYSLGNVRITFDRNISASDNFERLFDRQISKIAVLPTGYSVLEVKYNDFLPDIIYQTIDLGHMQQNTFSKFYLGCKALEGRLHDVI